MVIQDNTWEVTYTDANGELRTELIEAYGVETGNQHVSFLATGKGKVFLIDQRAMHSARNISALDMGTTPDKAEANKVDEVTD